MKDDEIKARIKGKSPKLLEVLLTEYSQRWKLYINLIWSISGIFIPLSLSGIAVALNNWLQTAFVGVFSMVLIWVWYFVTRELRLSADQNRQVCVALESELLKAKLPTDGYGLLQLAPVTKQKKIHVCTLRKVIAIVITAGWSLTIVASLLDLSRFTKP